jgi:uncharacterized membrane protein YhaH (DUF805 family)
MQWYLNVLKNYAVFQGRTRRQEYWMFYLINALILLVLYVAESMIETPVVRLLYCLALLLPSWGVTVRRLHDTGRSGWWLLIALIPIIGSIVLLVFTCQDSQPNNNQYGPNPKDYAKEEVPFANKSFTQTSSAIEEIYCSECGQKTPVGKFCIKCGEALKI